MPPHTTPVEGHPAAGEQAGRGRDCLFDVWELLADRTADLDDILRQLIAIIPAGMQYPDYCRAKITFANHSVCSQGYKASLWYYVAEIRVGEQRVGAVVVNYDDGVPAREEELFSSEEARMIDAIAERLAHTLELRDMVGKSAGLAAAASRSDEWVGEWRVLVNTLRRSDLDLFFRLAHKMIIHLCLRGVAEAEGLLAQRAARGLGAVPRSGQERDKRKWRIETDIVSFGDQVFDLGGRSLSNREIFLCLQRWMHEERCHQFVRSVVSPDSSLSQIEEGVEQLCGCSLAGVELSDYILKAARVHLIQRFLSEQLDFVQIAKTYVAPEDFRDLIPRLICVPGSHGRIGAKGAGLFLAAQVLRRRAGLHPELEGIRTPETWYVTTESLLSFMRYNDLEDVMEQKFKKIEQVRKEYPFIVQLFRNSRFPPAIVQGLAHALDELGDVPLMVRSSSLLEDQFGARFRRAYGSRFLANRGGKQERLDALTRAIGDVFASLFGPDPIEHRAAHGLIDFEEDMGVLIQQVVGHYAGPYFLPLFSGVADSSAEQRRFFPGQEQVAIARLVPGLGTQTGSSAGGGPFQMTVSAVSAWMREHSKRTPAQIEVINTESDEIESLPATEFFLGAGAQLPGREILLPSSGGGDLPVSFDALVHHSNFADRIRYSIEALDAAFGAPVEIEFASDGEDLYLLQCRKRRPEYGEE